MNSNTPTVDDHQKVFAILKMILIQFKDLKAENRFSLRTIIVFITFSLLFSCKEEAEEPTDYSSIISIETLAVTDISYRSATLHGNLEISVENQSVSDYGHCWGTDAEPDIEGQHASNGLTSKDFLTFESLIENLEPATTYNVRAYFIKSELVFYGESESFTTIQVSAPALSTDSVTSITATSAVSGGAIGDDNGSEIASRGVVWSNSSGPTLESNEGNTKDGSGTGAFSSSLTGLSPGTTYYVCAYATNEAGTEYGEEKVFTSEDGLPEISTSPVTSITAISAVSGGTVSADGGFPVTLCGVVWGTSSGPTLESNDGLTNDGSGTGSYNSLLNGLLPNTTYYVSAYATNEVGTVYGEEMAFTTEEGLPELTTSLVTYITDNGAFCGGSVISDGGSPVTSRGVVWGTSSGPTLEDSEGFSDDGSGSGTFMSLLTGLSPGKTYYVCAYATNSVGTEYGEEKAFNTVGELSGETGTLTDIDGNTYIWIRIGTQVWMAENLKTTRYADGSAIPHVEGISDWYNLGTDHKAYCWYNDSTEHRDVYGGLYTWAAAMNGSGSSSDNPSGIRGACPAGWHLPSDAEWKELEMYLGMSQAVTDATGYRGTEEGGMLKESGFIHWKSPNTGATNESGFTALPGGKKNSDGPSAYLGWSAFFWTATEFNRSHSWNRNLSYYYSVVIRNYEYRGNGYSVRCVLD